MQKLDFVQAVEKVYKEMHSEEVVSDIETSLTPGLSKYGNQLAIRLLEMFSNYNSLKKDKQYAEILKALNGEEIFTPEGTSDLFKLFQGDIGQIDPTKNREFRLFLDFHFGLNATYNLTKSLLSEKRIRKSLGESGSGGIIVFEVYNEESGLSTSEYSKILTKIGDLVEAVSFLVGEESKETNVISLDSGSNTNIAIETAVKTAQTLIQIFKEVIDLIRFRKHDRLEKDNQTLMNTLDILSGIKKKVDDKVITEEEGQIYGHRVKSALNELLKLNVRPKELVPELAKIDATYYLNRGTTGLLTDGQDIDKNEQTPD
jgi:hypothetical protein